MSPKGFSKLWCAPATNASSDIEMALVTLLMRCSPLGDHLDARGSWFIQVESVLLRLTGTGLTTGESRHRYGKARAGERRVGDWGSDVCSSDLSVIIGALAVLGSSRSKACSSG